MFQFVIGLGVALVLIILFLVFRIGTLLSIVKGSSDEPGGKSNKINAILFLLSLFGLFGLFFWYSFAYFDEYTLPLASVHGAETDWLFWVTTAITGVVFVITHILLFVFPFKYRYKKENRAHFFPDNNKLELLWTVIPALVLTALIFKGLLVWNDITAKAPEDAEVIEMMGYQFAWKARYPGADNELGSFDYQNIDATNEFGLNLDDQNMFDDFVPREVHLPKGHPVLFKIRARDVIHSVFAPHFRLKMDAVPGMYTQFHFVPTKTTAEMREETGNPEFNYEIACTEICGRGHFAMRMLVVVDEPEDYEKWKKEQTAWLNQNADYLDMVPDNLKEAARVKAGIASSETPAPTPVEVVVEETENEELNEADASL